MWGRLACSKLPGVVWVGDLAANQSVVCKCCNKATTILCRTVRTHLMMSHLMMNHLMFNHLLMHHLVMTMSVKKRQSVQNLLNHFVMEVRWGRHVKKQRVNHCVKKMTQPWLMLMMMRCHPHSSMMRRPLALQHLML